MLDLLHYRHGRWGRRHLDGYEKCDVLDAQTLASHSSRARRRRAAALPRVGELRHDDARDDRAAREHLGGRLGAGANGAAAVAPPRLLPRTRLAAPLALDAERRRALGPDPYKTKGAKRERFVRDDKARSWTAKESRAEKWLEG